MSNDITNEAGAREVAWYALYTRHQHEKSVAGALSIRGFEVFLPLYEEIRHWSDRQKKLQLPLFPCYVFVRFSLNRKLDILQTAGVHGFVGIDHHPAAIPPLEIEDLRRVLKLVRIEPHPFLRCGDWVRVKSGPLEGIEGFLVRRKGRARLVLSVEMLHESAAMEIDAVLTERISRWNVPRSAGFAAGDPERLGAAV